MAQFINYSSVVRLAVRVISAIKLAIFHSR